MCDIVLGVAARFFLMDGEALAMALLVLVVAK